MIHDVDETIKQILYQDGRINRDDIDIVFDQPTGDWAATLRGPTINIYLYDLRENLEKRNTSQVMTERKDDGTGVRRWAPRRIDVSYLITVWARNPEDEHQLLWRVLQTLLPMSFIHPRNSVGAVRDQPLPIPVRAALPSDAVRNMPDLWGVMENQLKPSVNLLLTLALDPDKKLEAPLVLSTKLGFGQYDGNPNGEIGPADDVEVYHIGGRVLEKDKPAGGGIRVNLVDHPREVETDADGRFVFPYMRPGKYAVEVTPEGKKSKKFNIEIPSDTYDLSL